MNENEIASLADDMLWEHGLSDWTFEFDRAKVRLGCCHYDEKRITLSRPLAEIATHAEIVDCLLHEIAHALAPRASGHDKVWREIAISIGCDGTRCHSLPVYDEAKYNYTCECGIVHSWHRKPKALGRRCQKCGHVFVSRFNSNGEYVGANDLEYIVYRVND